jgi:hypothetical protein
MEPKKALSSLFRRSKDIREREEKGGMHIHSRQVKKAKYESLRRLVLA